MDYVIEIVEQSGKELTDYQIRIEITDPNFFSKCTDQKFVEFYDEDQATLLNHYTELFDTVNKKAVFWVKVPSIPANGTKYIYLNINTERTEDLSDGEATFDFFDDFEDGTIDTAKWDTSNAGGVFSETDSYLYKNGANKYNLKSVQTFHYPFVFETEYYVEQLPSDNMYENVGGFAKSSSDGFGLAHNISPAQRLWYNGNVETVGSDDVQGRLRKLTIIAMEGKSRAIDYDYGYDSVRVDEERNAPIEDEYLYLGSRVILSGSDAVAKVRWYWVRVRKYTEPEPSVTVTRFGTTPTYELKLKIAQALAGETTTILDTDPKLRLLSGTDIIKELSLTAKTVYKDATSKRVVVAFLFVDDSSDSYTTDNQELLFTKDNTEYVAFKSDKSFTKVADKRLPLRWEIYLPYDVDVCTYEETMTGCL